MSYQYHPTGDNWIALQLPAAGRVFAAMASPSIRRPGAYVLRWLDTIPNDNGGWLNGWAFWPDMAAAGLLEDGPIIPGTYGDSEIYITAAGLHYAA